MITYKDGRAAGAAPDRYIEICVDTAKVIDNWRGSLFSFEWLDKLGHVKPIEALRDQDQERYKAVMAAYEDGTPLEKPVLGIGLHDTLEIGSGKAVLLTLAALGVGEMPVHILRSNERDFKDFIVSGMAGKGKREESGNVLFYILIAVVLLAALSFAVSQDGRGSVETLSKDRARLAATDVLSYADTVGKAVGQLRLRGYSMEQISFENNIVAGYINANCTDDGCKVFHPEGGALTWISPPDDANDDTNWVITDDMEVENIGRTCGADGCEDLTLQLLGVDAAVCQQINDMLDVAAPGTLPVNPDNSAGLFTGTYAYVDTIGDVAGSAKLAGLKAGCFTSTADSHNVFYKVLLAR